MLTPQDHHQSPKHQENHQNKTYDVLLPMDPYPDYEELAHPDKSVVKNAVAADNQNKAQSLENMSAECTNSISKTLRNRQVPHFEKNVANNEVNIQENAQNLEKTSTDNTNSKSKASCIKKVVNPRIP